MLNAFGGVCVVSLNEKIKINQIAIFLIDFKLKLIKNKD
jgi:hypothetical protein